MAGIIDETTVSKPETVKNAPKARVRRFVNAGMSPSEVLQCDAEDVELMFEHEQGKFLALSDSDIQKLHHDNRVRYNMSQELNRNHDPERDGQSTRLQVVAANERRKQFEQVVRTTSQSARATKKLQAFVGEGYEPIWSRTDKIEDRLAKGYEIVKPQGDIYAGVSATDGHYETRVKQGETELVLMRIRREDKAKIMAQKAEAAKRLDMVADTSGASELRAMGATLVKDDQGGAWQDR